jgi:BlaI family penicillinase repressor
MSRPKQSTPTDGELEILKVLWSRGPATVRDVLTILNEERPRAYTSVMSLMNIMADKGLVTRQADGKAFVYAAASSRESTLGGMIRRLLGSAFDDSSKLLVAHMLDESKPSKDELDEIRKTIDTYQKKGKA